MDGRDDTAAKQTEDVFGRIAVALRDSGAAFPNTVRHRPPNRPLSPLEAAPTVVPYQIPPLVIDDGQPAWRRRTPPSRPLPDRSRDHAAYAGPHLPRRSIPPAPSSASQFPTEKIVRTGMHSVPGTSLSTYAFFVMVALTVVAMSAAALAYARPEAKRASVALLDPTLSVQNATQVPMPATTTPVTPAPTPTVVPTSAPTPAAMPAPPAKKRGHHRGAKSKARR